MADFLLSAGMSVPRVIFVLGGGAHREQFAAQFASRYPNLEIWISGGMPEQWSIPFFESQNIPRSRLRFFPATNTVENFTSVLPAMRKLKIKQCFLVTDTWHMERACAIALILLKIKNGISYTPISIPSPYKPTQENYKKIIRDVIRAFCS